VAGTELMFPEAMQINSFQLTSLIEVFNLTATPLITFVYMKCSI
jgi:NADH:ubiquinone oxidoreductase subunit 3 (subunit A)